MSDETLSPTARANRHHKILIIGGGSAGISVAARLRRAGESDVAVVEPSTTHYYQPAWTLVGCGATRPETTARPTERVIPRGTHWIRDQAVEIDADAQIVRTKSSGAIHYDFLVACPGLQLDWSRVPGLEAAMQTAAASSNYTYELAPKTWRALQSFDGGTALFTCPTMPIKCPGAPQKIAYLACDHFMQRGVRGKTQVIYATATPTMFAVPEYAAVLNQVVERYEIDVRFTHNLVRVNPDRREAVFESTDAGTQRELSLHYDFLHAVPPQSAPDFIKRSPLADPGGWIDVDKHTLRHTRYPNVFGLGDATNTPNSKTGAAIRDQAPILVENLLASIAGRELPGSYGGYGACPLTTSYNTVLLAEFDYSKHPTPSIPLIDTMKERRDMWWLKKYGLPWMYWNLMLKGRV